MNTEKLLDLNYSSLSMERKNEYLLTLLAEILKSSAIENEWKDALEVFEDYEWAPKPNTDLSEFRQHMDSGIKGHMNKAQLDTFMDSVSESGQYHLYYLVAKGDHIVRLQEVSECSGGDDSSVELDESSGENLKNYTVIGFYGESDKIFSHWIKSTSPMAALTRVSVSHDDAIFTSVLDGFVPEGEGVTFPGESLVHAATVLEQTSVFG